MNEAFEKILEMLEEERELSYADFSRYVEEVSPCLDAEYDDFFHRGLERASRLVKEVAKEYKEDMKYNLSEMYAKNMVDYGVDVTKEYQTATQQSCALEKAYISGRKYESDRFNKLRKEYNSGWIPCS